MPVANVTELANSNTIGNALSAVASPAFVKGTIAMNHLMAEDLPQLTNVKKFRKNGSVTAAIVAEATANAIDANGELTDSAATCTAAKAVVVSGLSVEEQKFGTIDLTRIGNEQFNAIARYVDDDWLSQFSNLSTVITSTAVMTIDDIMQGQLAIYNAKCPNQEVPLSIILGPKAVYNIKKEIIQSGAAAFSNSAMLGVFGGQPVQANGLVGSITGVGDVYQTTGFATGGGDDTQAIVHPMWAHCGIFDTAPVSWLSNKGSEGFYTEVASYYFYDIAEWNDGAGAALKSDT